MQAAYLANRRSSQILGITEQIPAVAVAIAKLPAIQCQMINERGCEFAAFIVTDAYRHSIENNQAMGVCLQMHRISAQAIRVRQFTEIVDIATGCNRRCI